MVVTGPPELKAALETYTEWTVAEPLRAHYANQALQALGSPMRVVACEGMDPGVQEIVRCWRARHGGT